MAHEPHPQGGSTFDRLALPLLLPLAAAAVTAVLIVAIGNLLLSFGGQYLAGPGFQLSTPVAVALALALAVLLGCTLASATWGRSDR